MTLARTQLEEAFQALHKDLVSDDGPRISTMRNYRFAIVPYAPEKEFELRERTQHLVTELSAKGWVVLTISLQTLLLRRVRALGDEVVQRIIEMERRTAQVAPERGLAYLRSKLQPLLEGPEGLAADIAAEIQAFARDNPDRAERALVLVGRAGALYPFIRVSALLKHLAGNTDNLPVVMLYPGDRRADAGLSFMGELAPDRDYRPRIYP